MYMGLKICIGAITRRYYKHTKFHEMTLNSWLILHGMTHTTLNCEVVPSRLEIIKQQWLLHNYLAHHHISHCNSKNH